MFVVWLTGADGAVLCIVILVYFFKALMALFVLASKDGWVSIMYTGLDAVGIDQQVCELVSWILIVYSFYYNYTK